MKCPKGHELPYKTCTPLYCLDQPAAKAKNPAAKALVHGSTKNPTLLAEQTAFGEIKVASVEDEVAKIPGNDREGMKEAAEEEKDKLAKTLSRRVGAFAARKALMAMPAGLTGADAEEWAQKELANALPEAVAELRFHLRYGDNSERIAAARDVLDANGMRKKDGGSGGGATIILNVGTLPWEKKPNEKVVSGEAARSEEGKIRGAGD